MSASDTAHSGDGADLADVDPATVWNRTGLVPQIFAQWPLRVRENVTLGQPRTVDDGPVWEAVDAVGMREAIEDLSSGLDTLLAREIFGGAELSGEQWQRLACSRALYRRPPLLILDEPTSQMDPRRRAPDLRKDQGDLRRPHHHCGHPPPGEHQGRRPHHRHGGEPDHRTGPLHRPTSGRGRPPGDPDDAARTRESSRPASPPETAPPSPCPSGSGHGSGTSMPPPRRAPRR